MKLFTLFLPVFFIGLSACSGGGTGRDHGGDGSLRRAKDTAEVNRTLDRLEKHRLSDYNTSLALVRQAGSLAAQSGYPEGQARAAFEYGNLLYSKNNYREALKKYSDALDLAKRHNLTQIEAHCLERLASLHMIDDPGLAFRLYNEARVLFERIPDSAGLAKVFNVIAFYYVDQEKYDTAEQYFRTAMSINQRTGNTYYLIENRGNLAYLYTRSGKTDSSERIYRDLIRELSAMHDSVSLQIILYQLSSLYIDKGMTDTALVLMDQAIRVAEPVKDLELLVTLYGYKGDLLFRKGKIAEAAVLLRKSADLAHSIDDPITEAEALSHLMRIDSLHGDFRSAYLKSRTMAMLKDTINERNERNDIRKTELKFENEKRQKTILDQEEHILLANREKVLYRILFFISLLAGGLVVAVLIQQRKNLRKGRSLTESRLTIRELQLEAIRKDKEIDRLRIEKMEEEIKGKERELLLHAMNVEQKNEFLNVISKTIRENLVEQPGSDPVAVVNGIVSSIKMQQTESGETELFNQQFAQVHESFFTNLKKAHPGLTKSETRFCAYLRLNLSGNQIARNLHVTSEAIRKTRYRIRKKMNLSPDDSLEDYIARF